jgi:large subunit ribosomal protein L17
MFRNMVTSLLKYDRIKTTDTKAKELRRWADHIITLAKRGDLHARRQALAIVREKSVVHKIFEEADKRFGGISGGYTRITKIGRRPGDAAPISIIELIATEPQKKKKKTKPAAKSKATTKTASEKKSETSDSDKKESAAKTEQPEPAETPEPSADVEEAAEKIEAPVETAAETAPAEVDVQADTPPESDTTETDETKKE